MPQPAGTAGSIGTGVCGSHQNPTPYTTILEEVTAVPTVLINSKPAAVFGTTGISTCGHPTKALTGSLTVSIGGRRAHRVLDVGANFGPYTLVSGILNVIIG